MKTKIIAALLLLSLGIAQAQTEKKKATVRIKKVEMVNGKEKITDTTFVMDDSENQIPSNVRIIKKGSAGQNTPAEVIIMQDAAASTTELSDLPALSKLKDLPEIPAAELEKAGLELEKAMRELNLEMEKMGKAGICMDSLRKNSSQKIVVITDEDDDVSVISRDGSVTQEDKDVKGQKHKVVIMVDGDTIKEDQVLTEDVIGKDLQEAMKNAGESNYVDKVVSVNVKDGKDGKEEVQKIVIIKKVRLAEVSEQDQKMLEKQTGLNDQKLKLDQMNFFPNPNTGKFKLSFNLQDRGDTEINILNMEGKAVYHQQLKSFSGNYDQEIDISSQPKGVYFVKVAQGSHSYVKKLMIE